jgi:hypothetical protein
MAGLWEQGFDTLWTFPFITSELAFHHGCSTWANIIRRVVMDVRSMFLSVGGRCMLVCRIGDWQVAFFFQGAHIVITFHCYTYICTLIKGCGEIS